MAGIRDEDLYKRRYVRPDDRWVCGRMAEGRPCPHGPSRRGKCAIRFECAPAKIGDRWVCTRPEQYGGPCDNPALPESSFGPFQDRGAGVCCRKVHCTPQRSLRARRGVFSLVACALASGLLLVAVGSPWRDQALSPGPLTVHHQGASMASLEPVDQRGPRSTGDEPGAKDESCHICHTTLDDGLKGLLASAMGGGERISQSAQCLSCHDEDIGADALRAHALPDVVLSRYTEDAARTSLQASRPLSLALASLSPGVRTGAGGEIACAACHHEHNGAFFELKRMANDSCQTCHTRQFRSVNDGHPEFSTRMSDAGYDYPYRRRTRIIYDHARHETNYFKKDENRALAPEDCSACHTVDAGANTTRLVSYEQMCAACHDGNIVSARDDWIHVFGFPSLETDVYEILESDGGAEAVPRTAGKSLSPFMLLLLSGINRGNLESEQVFLADLAKIAEFEGDLSGIAYDDDPKIVTRLFDGLESVRDSAMNPDSGGMREAFRGLIERASGAALSARQLDTLLGTPEPGATIAKVEEEVSRKDIVEMSGWHVRGGGYRIDPAAWAATVGALPEYAALKAAGGGGLVFERFGDFSAFKAWFEGHIIIDGRDWKLRTSGEELKSKDWEALVVELSGASEAPNQEVSTASAEVEAFNTWFASLSNLKGWFDSNIDHAGGMWSLRAPQSLYYRPIQHADPFMAAWLDLAGALYAENPAAAMLFDQISGRKTGSTIGACAKCHSIDAEKSPEGDAFVRVNWKSRPTDRDFTKFNHSPHLKLMDCSECHTAPWVPAIRERTQVVVAEQVEEQVATEPVSAEVAAASETAASADSSVTDSAAMPAGDDPASDSAGTTQEAPVLASPAYLDSFKTGGEGLEIGVNFTNSSGTNDTPAPVFTSNFGPIVKADCVRCHVPDKAGNDCLICHNYHIQPTMTAAGIRSLNDLIMDQVTAIVTTQTPE